MEKLGKISKLSTDSVAGFITKSGTVQPIPFDKDCVSADDFHILEVGTKVKFLEEKDRYGRSIRAHSIEIDKNLQKVTRVPFLKTGILCAAMAAYWAYIGFVPVGAMLNYKSIEENCSRFITENNNNFPLLYGSNSSNIKIVKSTFKSGHVVVEFGKFGVGNHENRYTPIICISDGRSIIIPSLLDQGKWR